MRMLVMLATSVSGGIAQWVEHSTADREVPGSNPGAPYFFFFLAIKIVGSNGVVMRMLVMLATSVSGGIAQWVEHSTADREVPGSNPGAPYFFFF